MDYAAEQVSLSQSIFTTDSFLKDTVITVDDFSKDERGKTIVDRLAFAPKVYRVIVASPWILAGLTLLSATAYVLLSRR